jgi:hypothetical protein
MSQPALSDELVARQIDDVAQLLDLQIEPSWRPSIQSHLKVLLTAARLVLDTPLDDHIEAAAIYRA